MRFFFFLYLFGMFRNEIEKRKRLIWVKLFAGEVIALPYFAYNFAKKGSVR